MSECRPAANKRLHYDPTVSLGNILTAASLVVAVAVFGLRLEGQVALNKNDIETLERRVERERVETADRSREIKRMLERIEEKLDRKADK